jgi:hypothetical protein
VTEALVIGLALLFVVPIVIGGRILAETVKDYRARITKLEDDNRRLTESLVLANGQKVILSQSDTVPGPVVSRKPSKPYFTPKEAS